MQREKKDKHFIKKPIYKGGSRALRAFISKNLKYPQAALEAKIEGTVTVRYTIDRKGVVTDGKVIAGLGYGCDEEAVRLVKLLKFTVPRQQAKRLHFHKTIHIHFRIPETVQQKVTYNYKITSKESHQPLEKGSSYHYSIKLRS